MKVDLSERPKLTKPIAALFALISIAIAILVDRLAIHGHTRLTGSATLVTLIIAYIFRRSLRQPIPVAAMIAFLGIDVLALVTLPIEDSAFPGVLFVPVVIALFCAQYLALDFLDKHFRHRI